MAGIALLCGCSNPRGNVDADTVLVDRLHTYIAGEIDSIKKSQSVAELFNNGFTEIAFYIIDDTLKQDTTLNTKLYFAQLCIDNGNFEKGVGYINGTNSATKKFELLDIKTAYALNKMDTSASAVLLDSMCRELYNNYTPERQLKYLIQKSYRLHNCKRYDSAIFTLKSAIDTFSAHSLDSIYLARIYRKLGNSYNDQTRNVIEPNKAHAPKFVSCIGYYAKERAILTRRQNEENKIIGNLITNGLVMINVSVDSYRHYLLHALGKALAVIDSDYIIARDPIYASVCCNYLSAERIKNFTSAEKELSDSLLDLNQRLLTQKAIMGFCSAQGMDIKLCYPQGNYKLKFGNAQKDSTNRLSSLDLANISNLTKYSHLQAFRQLQTAYGSNAAIAIKYWALMHEISLWKSYTNHVAYEQATEQLLSKYSTFFKPIDNCVHPYKLTQSDISKLTRYCQRHAATIFDYLLIYETDRAHLITLIFDSSGLHSFQTIVGKNFPQSELNKLTEYVHKDSIKAYANLANKLYHILSLDATKSPNIVISPCEQLEQFPIDALTTDSTVGAHWQQVNFFFDHHATRCIPNIESILHQTQTKPINEKINILYSKNDNNVLPANNYLIQDLTDKFGAVSNQTVNYPILHIVDHTQTDPNGNLYFGVPENTISIFTNTYRPSLAVLHGCSSGNGNFISTEGYLSLTRMFLYNGTSSVISSCWKTDNTSSCELFRVFYVNLMAGKNVSTSLHGAQSAIKDNPSYVEWASPYYWSNWKLTGQDLFFIK